MKKISFLVAFSLSALLSSAPSFALSDFYENKLIDTLLRGQTFDQATPTDYYVALFTTPCTDAAGGTEVVGGGYARVQITRSLAAWNGTHGNTTGASSGNSGTVTNASILQFPNPTAAWGAVTSFGLYDASVSGNMVVCNNLTTPKTINSGDSAPAFAAGALAIIIN